MVLKIAPILIGLWLLSGCSETGSPESKTSNEEVSPPDGEMLFLNNCAACHGTDGKLGTSGAFDLTQTKLGTEEIKQIIIKGRNGMPPFEYLIKDDSEIDAVVEYTESLKK